MGGRIDNALSLSLNGDFVGVSETLPSLLSELTPVEQEMHATHLASMLESSLLVEDSAAVERLLTLLRGRQLTLESLWMIHVLPRPIFRVMGDAAAVLDHSEEARGYYEQNLALCEKIGHRPELAITRAHLAELLLDHYPDERAEAVEHLDFAIREFQDMKMQPSLERALRHRELLKA